MAVSLKQILSYPPHILAQKAITLARKILRDRKERPHYCLQEHRIPEIETPIFPSYFSKPPSYLPQTNIDVVQYLSKKILEHRFDLLGSGWVSVGYFAEAPGLEEFRIPCSFEPFEFDAEGNWLNRIVNKEHLAVSQEYWKIIIQNTPNYQPIDWQKDYKSGYRWSAKVWGKDSRKHSDFIDGADLKAPWELSRLQHLPRLAVWAHQYPELAEVHLREFKSQILDFFMSNPPSMGVNNNCAMDMGIRAANILLSFDLFRSVDLWNILDDQFFKIIETNLRVLGKNILEDVEYREGITSNHYLGNVAGIAWLGSYLPESELTRSFIIFAADALVTEMDRQFFADGGNFEGSTSYHRLSGEMMAWSSMLLDSLSSERKEWMKQPIKHWKYSVPINKNGVQKVKPQEHRIFPTWYYERLGRAAQLSREASNHLGQVAQFGDNDSGRFISLWPIGQWKTGQEARKKYLHLSNYFQFYSTEEHFWDEDHLNHSEFIHLTENKSWPHIPHNTQKGDLPVYTFCRETVLWEGPRPHTIQLVSYPIFGLYGWKAHNFSLHISAINNVEDQHFHWGHKHNDQLSFELVVDQEQLVLDSGTYLYTPIPHRRNEFRSVSAHPVPVFSDEETNHWESGRRGLFRMNRTTNMALRTANESEISLYLRFKETECLRTFYWEENQLIMRDQANREFRYPSFEWYSNGYGKRERSTCKRPF
jgi:hypothetical protein